MMSAVKNRTRWAGALCCLLLAGDRSLGQSFADLFFNQRLVTGASLTVTGSNTNATVETGEPKIDDKTGGHSVWISWQAPADGIVTVTTDGSSFDTLLGVYFEEPGDDPPFQRLQGVGDNDDHDRLETSRVQFGARSNQIYEITVDGYYGATGSILLNLTLQARNLFERALLHTPDDSAWLQFNPAWLAMPAQSAAGEAAAGSPLTDRQLNAIDSQEYRLIKEALSAEGGGIRRAAARLGITHQALLRRLEKWPELRQVIPRSS